MATGVSISTTKAAEQRESWCIIAVLARAGPAVSGLLGAGTLRPRWVGVRMGHSRNSLPTPIAPFVAVQGRVGGVWSRVGTFEAEGSNGARERLTTYILNVVVNLCSEEKNMRRGGCTQPP